MGLSASPAAANPLRIWSTGAGPANRTYTSVPPRKSIPYLMPPFFRMAVQPAMSRIAERATKYFALPIQSTLTFLKNSIQIPIHLCLTPCASLMFPIAASLRNHLSRDPPLPSSLQRKHLVQPMTLDTQRFLPISSRQIPVENRPRNVDRSEHVRQQTDNEGYGETFHRPSTEQK